MKRFVVALLVLLGPLTAGAQAPAGSAVIIGVVLRKDTGDSLGYSVVSVPSIAREQFTTDRGTFSLRELPVGALRLRFKHIGFTPRDTTVTLRDGDTLRLRIALPRTVVQLAAMRVTGACDTRRSAPDDNGAMAELFEQVRESAERYRLLAATHPFEMIVQRARGTRRANGQYLSVEIDTVRQPAVTTNPYRPGHLIRRDTLGIPGRPQYFLSVPELTDFADTTFINNHCFSYGGRETIRGIPAIRVDYQPVLALKDVPDVRGSIFVREDGYELIRAVMELTKIPREIGMNTFLSMRVETSFVEFVPGLSTIELMESSIAIRGSANFRGERGAVIDIKWANGPP